MFPIPISIESGTERIASPIWVSVRKAGDTGIPECVYDCAAQYDQNVCRALRDFQEKTFRTDDLMTHFSLPDEPEMEAALRAKISAARLGTGIIEDRLYAVVNLVLSAELTEEERDAFSDMLEAQYRDGWGQDFEVQSILTAQGEELCARLYHDGLTFLTGEAAFLEHKIIEEEISSRERQRLESNEASSMESGESLTQTML